MGALEKSIFMSEMFRGSFQLFFRGSNGQGVVSALFSGVKRSGSRLSPYLRGETKTLKIVEIRRCRLVPVLRAETNTLKIMEMRRCRLSPYLRGETKTQKIVEMRRCRLVPVLTYNVNTTRPKM